VIEALGTRYSLVVDELAAAAETRVFKPVRIG
jgi:hypothetical protein